MSHDDFWFRVLLPFVKKHRTQKHAAGKLGISRSYLSRILSGERQVNNKVARYFGYSVPNRKGERKFRPLAG